MKAARLFSISCCCFHRFLPIASQFEAGHMKPFNLELNPIRLFKTEARPNAGCCFFSSSKPSPPTSGSIAEILQKEFDISDDLPAAAFEKRSQHCMKIPENRRAFVEETLIAVNEIIHSIDVSKSPTEIQAHGHGHDHKHDNPHLHTSKVQGTRTKSRYEIIRLLMDRLNTNRWIDLDRDMRSYRIELRPNEVAWVLKVQKSPKKAWDFFTWASRRPGYTHNPTCFAIMIDLLGRCSEYSLLEDLLAEMKRLQVPYSVSTVNRLIEIYVAIEDMNKTEQYVLKLQKLGIQPNAYIYKCMLQAFAKAGNCGKALEIYGAMQKQQLCIDIISYNMLLDGLSKNGQVETAWNIFKEMKQYGIIADVHTYTFLIRTLGHVGMVGRAVELLDEMVQSGIQPNKHTYNTILDALASQDKLEDGIKLFKRMLEDGVSPDFLTCQAMLKSLCKGCQVGQALELVQCIKEKAVKEEVYESFIKVLGKMGFFQEALALFQGLKVDDIRPNQAVCLCMIDVFSQAAEPDEALAIMKEMEKNGGNLPINTYNSILAALCNGNQFQAAYDLFKQIKARGPPPDVVSYSIIIKVLVKLGKWHLEEALFEEMDRSGCMLDVITFNSLLQIFACLGDVESTRKLLQMMQAKAVTPDVVTYNCAIECFGRAGKPDLALKFFDEMREKGCSASSVTYNNVLLALAKAGLTDAVLSLFKQMKEQGFVPDAMTLAILGRVHESCPQLDKKAAFGEDTEYRIGF